MSKIQVFVSFDTDHDQELYDQLAEQAESATSSFEISGGSQPVSSEDRSGDAARCRIREADQVIVLCGEHTQASEPVGEELCIAREERKPYLLLWGRRDSMCTKPIGAGSSDGMYSWTQTILQDQMATLVRQARADAASKRPRAAAGRRR